MTGKVTLKLCDKNRSGDWVSVVEVITIQTLLKEFDKSGRNHLR